MYTPQIALSVRPQITTRRVCVAAAPHTPENSLENKAAERHQLTPANDDTKQAEPCHSTDELCPRRHGAKWGRSEIRIWNYRFEKRKTFHLF